MAERVLVRMSDKGRLVVPVQVREALGLKPGDILDLRVVDDELRITSFRNRILQARERLKQYIPPGVDAVEEFIAERRREAAREEEELEAWPRPKKPANG